MGQVASRCGVAVSTLHFYESKGLIHSMRTSGNQRRYHRAVLRRVSVIKVAQRLGIPLKAIADALEVLPQERLPTASDWRALSEHWRVDLDERITQMMQLRDQLGECIGCGCLSMGKCPLRNPNDTLGQSGSGAMLLEQQAGQVSN